MVNLKSPVFWGITASGTIAAFAVWMGAQEICNSDDVCLTKFGVFLASKPNEVGDTLAGFAGALAFVWIIVTVCLQTLELAEQRKELSATREELRLSREAQQNQLAALRAQAEIFQDERRMRREVEAGKLLEERLKGIAERVVREPKITITTEVIREGLKPQQSSFQIGRRFNEDLGTYSVLRQLGAELERAETAVKENKKDGTKYTNHKFDDSRIGEIEGLLERVIADFGNLSDADKQKVVNLRVRKIYLCLLELTGLSEVEE
ncbi:hypothetical protein [Ruegeria sp. HKCCA6837]|uniref:hypothetical protein n=1 Tax=Ruegeria sp. HKCCA6837 TaxID=2682989 RepID=UPI00148969D4|nr:hypothetical protein [Ruegeria sp. HKCCA6837]